MILIIGKHLALTITIRLLVGKKPIQNLRAKNNATSAKVNRFIQSQQGLLKPLLQISNGFFVLDKAYFQHIMRELTGNFAMIMGAKRPIIMVKLPVERLVRAA